MGPRLTTALLITLAGTILIVCASHAQAPDTLWTRTFGGGEDDIGATVQLADDGGYILVGYTQSYGAGSYDVWLVKTDANGNELWSHTYGGASDDFGHNVQRTNDGGYIIMGFTNSYGAGGYDVWLIKTDSSGNEDWAQTFGGDGDDKGHRVALTGDEGYIIGGETVSYGAGDRDFWLIKTDSLGNELWNRTFGGTEADYCHGVQQTDDRGYILAGPTHSSGAGESDFWLIKTDSSGYEQWSRTFGGDASDNCHSVLQTDDGGYILAGCSWSYGAGGCDYLLIRTDADGNEQWNGTFGGDECDCCYDVQPTGDGGYILAGWSYSYGSGGCDFWAVKTDSSGNEVWNRTVGGSSDDHGQSIQQTDDSGYILVGHTFSYGSGGKDVWLVRLDNEPSSITHCVPIVPGAFYLFPPHPNPFNPTTILSFELPMQSFVKLEVYDITGRLVGAQHAAPLLSEWLEAGTHEVTFDATDLSSGVYIYRLQAGDFKASGKMVLMK